MPGVSKPDHLASETFPAVMVIVVVNRLFLMLNAYWSRPRPLGCKRGEEREGSQTEASLFHVGTIRGKRNIEPQCFKTCLGSRLSKAQRKILRLGQCLRTLYYIQITKMTTLKSLSIPRLIFSNRFSVFGLMKFSGPKRYPY